MNLSRHMKIIERLSQSQWVTFTKHITYSTCNFSSLLKKFTMKIVMHNLQNCQVMNLFGKIDRKVRARLKESLYVYFSLLKYFEKQTFFNGGRF